tara:strand:- start:1098 stop:1685 length:588 start_codon:yes stop_codon:yes gene_type:complete
MIKYYSFILLIFFLLLSCEKSKYPINPKVTNIIIAKEGKHAAYFDKKEWMLKKNYNFFKCKPSNFQINININNYFNKYIEEYLNKSFQDIKFLQNPITLSHQQNNNYDTFINITKEKATVSFSYDGDVSTFSIRLEGKINIQKKDGQQFSSLIVANGIGEKKNFFNCEPKTTAKIAYENALSKYLTLIFKNINEF